MGHASPPSISARMSCLPYRKWVHSPSAPSDRWPVQFSWRRQAPAAQGYGAPIRTNLTATHGRDTATALLPTEGTEMSMTHRLHANKHADVMATDRDLFATQRSGAQGRGKGNEGLAFHHSSPVLSRHVLHAPHTSGFVHNVDTFTAYAPRPTSGLRFITTKRANEVAAESSSRQASQKRGFPAVSIWLEVAVRSSLCADVDRRRRNGEP